MTEDLLVHILSKPMPGLRPHTWVFGPNDEPLGIVFHTWPERTQHLISVVGITGKIKKKAIGKFVNLKYEGEEVKTRAVQVINRRYFRALLFDYRGLSAGDL